ncbi:MAG: ABC transporter substrate-binding protein [Nitrospina sp.]|nr:ABC transporter substrate-binding protein [Nitrospina sp.]
MENFKGILLNVDVFKKPRNTANSNKIACCLISIGLVLLSVALVGCDNKKNRTYTVGIMNSVPGLDRNLPGFKEGMTELGYIEGKNIRYIYNGPTTDTSKLSAAGQALVAEKVDLILSITTPATLAAKQATSDSGLPVVFSTVNDPVGAGIVDSTQHPGGNITGVSFGIQEARRLEWLIKIAPKIRRIYVPYNAEDKSPVLALKMARNAAVKLGVELITREFHDNETLNDAVLNIPADVDAVFCLPDSLMARRLVDMVTIATGRNLPTSVPNINNVKRFPVLCSFGNNHYSDARQAARLADQILKGTPPANLPVEISEFYLVLNLKVAKSIGLTIPDEILRQADILVR